MAADGMDRYFSDLVWDKLFVIDYACEMMPVRSFADLGGAWCDFSGGYSFYIMDKHRVPRGFLADGHSTEDLVKDLNRYPTLRFIQDNFAKSAVAERIGDVDVTFLFDVLYVQPDPGWEALLELYAPRTKCMLISNVHFPRLEQSVRLMDLGEEEYFKYVPATKDSGGYKNLFERLDEVHPTYACKHRDCHHYWQWGMTDRDLVEKMTQLGFRMHYARTIGKRDDIVNEAEGRVFAFFKDSMRLPCR
jgi:hypothetical protein